MDYLSSDIAHRLMMLAVEHMTSAAIQTSQKVMPICQRPRSFNRAKGITKEATNRSAMDRETWNSTVVNIRDVYLRVVGTVFCSLHDLRVSRVCTRGARRLQFAGIGCSTRATSSSFSRYDLVPFTVYPTRLLGSRPECILE